MSRSPGICPCVPIEHARAFLCTDVLWSVFVLADLAAPYAEHARLPVALDGDGQIVASCLIYDYPGDRSLVPYGSAEGIRAILAEVDLPDETYVVARETDWSVIDEFYEAIGEFRTMLRMSLTRERFVKTPLDPAFTVQFIHATEYEEVDALYEPWGGITIDLLPDGQVFGARDADGRLCAVAVATACNGLDGIGTIGGVFTHPDRRGQGLGKAVTSTACQYWFDRSRHEIYLNVHSEDCAARSAYNSLGFTDRLRYRVMPARRRTGGAPAG